MLVCTAPDPHVDTTGSWTRCCKSSGTGAGSKLTTPRCPRRTERTANSAPRACGPMPTATTRGVPRHTDQREGRARRAPRRPYGPAAARRRQRARPHRGRCGRRARRPLEPRPPLFLRGAQREPDSGRRSADPQSRAVHARAHHRHRRPRGASAVPPREVPARVGSPQSLAPGAGARRPPLQRARRGRPLPIQRSPLAWSSRRRVRSCAPRDRRNLAPTIESNS